MLRSWRPKSFKDLIRVLDEDNTFNRAFRLYEFAPDLIFLRDVDEQPIDMKGCLLYTSDAADE